MSALLPSLITTLALDGLLVALFAALARRDPRACHLRAWALAWGFGALSHVGMVLRTHVGASVAFGALLAAVTLASALLTLTGAYASIDRPTPRWPWVLVVVGLVWSPIAEHLRLPLAAAAAPSLLAIILAYAVAGVVILRQRPRGAGERIAGASFLAIALHVADFPLVVGDPELFPLGLAVFALLQATIGFGFVLMHLDRAGRDLARSEERYRALFDNAVVGAFRCDDAGRFLAANPALAAKLGYPAVEALLAGPGLYDLFADDQERARLSGLFHVHGVVDGADFRWRRRDGAIITVSLHVRQLPGADGAPGHIEGLARDVTDSRRLQRRLAESERLEALGRLAGGVAHDFNNLLTVILNNAAMIDGPGLDRRQRDSVTDIVEAGKRGAALVRQLFLFGRADSSQVGRIDVGASARRTIRILSASLGEGVRAELEAASDAFVEASAAQLEQVVMNLVLNARDAMPGGGAIRVRVRRVAALGALEPSPSGAWILLEVEDDGVGFDEATRERAFEPFFTTKDAGTGLGLPTVYGVATHLGGAVEIDSAPGQGTRVRVHLPAAIPAQDAAAAPDDPLLP